MKTFLLCLGIGIAFVSFLVWDLDSYYKTPFSPENRQEIINIKSGSSLKGVAALLEEKQIIKRAAKFVFLGRLLGVSTQLKAGEYELSSQMSPAQIYHHLSEGRIYRRAITFPEGITLQQMAEILESHSITTQENFLRAARDPEKLKKWQIPGDSLEGYLFPDTYLLTKGMEPFQILEILHSRFLEIWKDVADGQGNPLNLSQHQLLTLASIVEKETSVAEEKSIVSAVFYNRLKRKMKLQSDPTVIYGLNNFQGNLTKELLLSPHPYNTYVRSGIPPGPICNPGKEAIVAAANPSPVNYLYFVSRNDGTHHFSDHYQSHRSAVNRYQKSLKKPRVQK